LNTPNKLAGGNTPHSSKQRSHSARLAKRFLRKADIRVEEESGNCGGMRVEISTISSDSGRDARGKEQGQPLIVRDIHGESEMSAESHSLINGFPRRSFFTGRSGFFLEGRFP
jgi:hypothetical protein